MASGPWETACSCFIVTILNFMDITICAHNLTVRLQNTFNIIWQGRGNPIRGLNMFPWGTESSFSHPERNLPAWKNIQAFLPTQRKNCMIGTLFIILFREYSMGDTASAGFSPNSTVVHCNTWNEPRYSLCLWSICNIRSNLTNCSSYPPPPVAMLADGFWKH